MHAAIAGGGIAGLTAAIALSGRGHRVDVFERAAVLEEVGAGIQLSPNAMAVLARLGVASGLQGRLSEPEALVIFDAETGATLARMPLGNLARERYGAPYCALHRADLQSALLGVARRDKGITIHLGAEVTGIEAGDPAVEFTAGGQRRRSDILVGADGVGSAIRTAHFRHAGAKSLGRNAWRATLRSEEVPSDIVPGVVGLWLAPGAHLVHYPISGGASLNVVVIATGDPPLPPTMVFTGPAKALLARIPEWHRQPLLALDPSRSWARGRVVLLGDAAHAMAPSAAQGGAQAIEDAWVLASALTDARAAADPADALASYARLRQPRVERIARMALRNLNIYEAKGISAIGRNSLLRALPATLMLAGLDWLFGWTPK